MRFSQEMRACMRTYGVVPARRAPHSQLPRLLAFKSSARIARRGPPCWHNTIGAHARAHPAMIQARKWVPFVNKCVFHKKCARASAFFTRNARVHAYLWCCASKAGPPQPVAAAPGIQKQRQNCPAGPALLAQHHRYACTRESCDDSSQEIGSFRE